MTVHAANVQPVRMKDAPMIASIQPRNSGGGFWVLDCIFSGATIMMMPMMRYTAGKQENKAITPPTM